MHPYKTIISPESVARVLVGIAINAVLTLRIKVNRKIQNNAEKRIRKVLALVSADNPPAKITGITGSTQGASTDSIQARNEKNRISIEEMATKRFEIF